MANDLKAQIDLLWKGQSAATQIDKSFNKIEKSIEDTDKALKDTTNTQKEFNKTTKNTDSGLATMTKVFAAAGIAVAAVGIAAKEAYEFIGEGADLLAAETKFDNLSTSINTTGDALLGKMQTATKGLVSDAELVAGATEIMNLGLAKTEAGTVRMASAVGALNLDLGVMALTLANDSTARLDSLGLSMEDVARTKKELINSGFIGDAFDEAVLIELEKKMVLLGDATDTTAGEMQQLEVAWANVTDEAKRGAATLAGPMVTSLNNAVVSQKTLNQGVEAGVITVKEYNEIVNSAASILEGSAEANALVNKRLEEEAKARDEANRVADEYLLYQQAMAGELENTTVVMSDYIGQTLYATQAQEEATDSTRAYMIEQVALANAQEEAALAAASEAASFAILSTTADATKAAISTMYSEEVTSAWNASAQIAQANADIITSLKEVALATIEAKATEAVAAGEITAEAANAYLAGVGEGLGLLSEDEANAQIAVGNASLEMAETLNTSLDYVKEHGEAVARTVGEMSGETAANIATTWEELDTQAQDAAVEAGVLDKKLAAMAENPYVINVEVRYTTTGTGPPSGTGSSPGATSGRAGGTGVGGLYEGGSFIVGETGPEVVTLPQGSNITNSQDMRNQSYTFHTSSSDTVMRQLARQGRRR